MPSIIENNVRTILNKDPNALFYINLTNGIEALDLCRDVGVPDDQIRFSSIQSTHLEQKTFDPMIQRLGADMLMNLACGKTCAIIDFGTDKTISRSVYQGVPFVKYCLERKWFEKQPSDVYIQPREYDATHQNVGNVYHQWYRNLSRRTKNFIGKFSPYANVANPDKTVRLIGVSDKTQHDGHPQFYVELFGSYINNS